MSNLKLNTLSKVYPSGALALYKINLELSDGELIAVVGGEKSGKTTLLRTISGLEEATEGQIIVGEKDVTSLDPADRDTAMIFHGNTLFPALNVYDNIAYGLKMRKASSALIEQRVKVVAEMLGLDEILYRKPKALTAEQKQKTVLARAIVREPKLYLFDDPFSGLDDNLRAKLRALTVNLQIRMNGTFIYATKNVNEALAIATRVMVLRDGMLQQIDTPANLYDYPANAYVAFTVGSPTVNFISDGKIVKDGESYFAQGNGLRLALPQNIVSRFEKIDDYVQSGRQVIIGVRPEDISVDGASDIRGTVEQAENIGGTCFADCAVGKYSFVCKGGEVKKGDEAGLSFDMTHSFVFDGETRLTLLSRDAGYQKTAYADADKMPLGYDEEEEIKKKLTLPSKKKGKKN